MSCTIPTTTTLYNPTTITTTTTLYHPTRDRFIPASPTISLPAVGHRLRRSQHAHRAALRSPQTRDNSRQSMNSGKQQWFPCEWMVQVKVIGGRIKGLSVLIPGKERFREFLSSFSGWSDGHANPPVLQGSRTAWSTWAALVPPDNTGYTGGRDMNIPQYCALVPMFCPHNNTNIICLNPAKIDVSACVRSSHLSLFSLVLCWSPDWGNNFQAQAVGDQAEKNEQFVVKNKTVKYSLEKHKHRPCIPAYLLSEICGLNFKDFHLWSLARPYAREN